MNDDELIARACPKIGSLGAAHYFIPETLERGRALGLDGLRFYFLGRGGVLGDVEAPVVASAFGYFTPAMVAKMWNTAREKAAPRPTARAYFEACAALGLARLSDLAGLEALCAALDAVNDAANPAGLALYAGVAAEPLADDLAERTMQLVMVLREFRGSAHLLAVLASGLDPEKAHFMHHPEMYKTFGYDEDHPPTVTEADRAALIAAEALTDRLVAPAYTSLDTAARDALVGGLGAMEVALAS